MTKSGVGLAETGSAVRVGSGISVVSTLAMALTPRGSSVEIGLDIAHVANAVRTKAL